MPLPTADWLAEHNKIKLVLTINKPLKRKAILRQENNAHHRAHSWSPTSKVHFVARHMKIACTTLNFQRAHCIKTSLLTLTSLEYFPHSAIDHPLLQNLPYSFPSTNGSLLSLCESPNINLLPSILEDSPPKTLNSSHPRQGCWHLIMSPLVCTIFSSCH